MKKSIILLLAFFCVSFFSGEPTLKSESPSQVSELEVSSRKIEEGKAAVVMQKLPLHFIENKGQFDEQVHYQLTFSGMNAYFTSQEIVYQLVQREEEKTKLENIRMTFVGMNEGVEVKGGDESEGKANYLIGSDPKSWVRGARTYKKIIYRELYPDIYLIVFGEAGKVKHEYRVKAGGEVGDIRIKYEGVEGIKVNEVGELEVVFDGGELREGIPVSYQRINGKKVEVECGYSVMEDNAIGFSVGEYEKDRELIIDPELSYSTYLGGNSQNDLNDIAVDGDGNAYVVGRTYSSNFPTTSGAHDEVFNGPTDAFITKLNTAGSTLVYSTFLGGSDADTGTGIAIDGSGNAYISGETGSTDFPTTPGAYDTTKNGIYANAFITKLNSTGSGLSYSTYLGGTTAGASASAIAIDGSGNAYVTGETESTDFPTTASAYDTSHNGEEDLFISKLDSTGSALLYSTYLGGTFEDIGSGIAVDGSGNAYVTGYTESMNFPSTPGAYDPVKTGLSRNVYITKLNSAGSALSYSTFLGEGGGNGQAIAVDGSGSAYVTGDIGTASFPTTPGAYDTTLDFNGDAYITKLNSAGSDLSYSTFLGASHVDSGRGIAVDGSGNAYVTGLTRSTDFPTTADAYDATHNGGHDDVFLTKINSAGSALDYSTYLGGSERDHGRAIAIDESGNAYISGKTESADFPTTPGAYDTTQNSSFDGFVAKFKLVEDPEMNVKVLGMDISDGATFNFGTLKLKKIVKGPIPFTIENLGAGPLSLTGSPDKVYLTGMAAGYFTVTQQPSSPIAPGGSTIFRIKCIYDSVPGWIPPGWQKTISFTVNIPNNDPDENPYDFLITGTVKK